MGNNNAFSVWRKSYQQALRPHRWEDPLVSSTESKLLIAFSVFFSDRPLTALNPPSRPLRVREWEATRSKELQR